MLFKAMDRAEYKIDDVDGRHVVEAYVAGIGNVDFGKDRIKKGAFRKTIAERFKGQTPPRIKVMREHRELIGIPAEIREEDEHLYTRSLISKTALGIDTVTLIKDGVIDKASIGYDPVKKMDVVEDGVEIRELLEVKLYEFSFLAFPMNDATAILSAKGMTGGLLSSVVEQILMRDINLAGVKEDETPLTVKDLPSMKRILSASRELAEMVDSLVKHLEPVGSTPGATEPNNIPQVDPDELRQSLRDALKTCLF